MNPASASRRIRRYLGHVLPIFCIGVLIIGILSPILITSRRQAYQLTADISTVEAGDSFESMMDSFDMLHSIYYSFCHNQYVLSAAARDSENLGREAVLMYNLKESTGSLPLYDVFDQSVIVQFKRNDAALIDSDLYYDKKILYEHVLWYEDMTYEQWQQNIWNSRQSYWPARAVQRPNGTEDCFTWNLTYMPGRASSISVSTLIPTHAIADMISLTQVENFYFSLYHDGEWICGTPEMRTLPFHTETGVLETVNNEPCYMITCGNASGTALRAGVPERLMSLSVKGLDRLILTLIVTALAVTVCLCSVYTWLYFKPVDTLIETLGAFGPSVPERDRPGRLLVGVNAYLREWQHEYHKAVEQTHVYILQRALDGMTLNAGERTVLAEMSVFNQPYVLLAFCCRLCTQDEKERTYAALQVWLPQKLPEAHLVMTDYVYAILPMESLPEPQQLDRLTMEVDALTDVNISMAMSAVHQSVDELAACAQEIHWLFFVAAPESTPGLQRYGLPLRQPEGQGVAFQKYVSLAESLTRGESQRVSALFEEFRTLLLSNALDTQHSQRMLSNIEEALSPLAHQLNLPLECGENRHAAVRLEKLQSAALQICQALQNQRQSGPARVRKMLTYIDEHFHDPECSLTMLAEHFGLSEKYISALIKNELGMNYGAYIESLRMRRARELLTAGQESIDSVMHKAGYSDKSTFYKAFKRYWGVTPGSVQGAKAE